MSNDTTALAMLPPRLREIAGVVGVDATLKLAASSLGGLRLYVPKVMTADHPIAKAIGMAEAQRLCKHYQGAEIALPRGLQYRRALVRARALERYYAGESASSVAADLDLHEITIYNWAGEDKRVNPTGQPGLF